MNPRKLIPLVFLLLVLVVLALLVGRKKPQDEFRLEAGLRRLAPEDFLVSDVGRLEIFLGSKKDRKVLLEKAASGWRVYSYFNGPGDSGKVVALLDKFKSLEGEFRVADRSVLGDFGLTEERAIHFSIYKKKSDQAWLHLLVGKSLPNGGFVRLQGEDSVYVLDQNLRREIGLFADDLSKGPEQLPWIDKTIIAVKKEDVERLSMTWPDRESVFEKRRKKDSPQEESPEGASPQKKAPSPNGFEWVAGGSPAPFPIKEKGVDQILEALAGLTAVDIIDPQDKNEKGLDEPPFQCTVTLAQGEEKTLIASHPDPFQDGYMMVEGGDGTLFRVSRHTFQEVFKKGADLFEIPSFSVEKKSIEKICLTWPEKSLVLEKTAAGKFRALLSGSEEKRISQEKAKKIWDSLAKISPADFVHGRPEFERGLQEARYQATFVMKNGQHHVIAFGAEARGLAGRYMKIGGDPKILIMAKADFDRIFLPMDQLFESPTTDKGD